MMKFNVEKGKIISWFLFIVFANLFVFWDIFFGPENAKYFSVVYLVVGVILMVFRIPIILFKRAWAFYLLVIINFVALFVHFFDTASFINIITLVLSFTVLYYLVVGGMKYLGDDEFEEIAFKYLQYILLISLIVSPILTFLKWPYATEYFPWDALFSDKRFLLIAGKDVGHSYAMWLMAFSGAFIIRNIFRQKKHSGNLIRILFLLLLTWGLVETKSRTALLFIIILLLEWASYSNLFSKRLYALVPMIGIIVFYLSILNPLNQLKVDNVMNDLQKTYPAIRIVASTESKISAYSGRDILNIALISSFTEHPWFGAGHSAPILLYGVNGDGYIAYDGNKIGLSESMLRMLVKYGLFYFAFLLSFVLVPLIRAFKGYYRDNTFVISVCSIILVSGINSNIFENLYDISALFTVLILIFLVVPKYDKRKFIVDKEI